MNIYIDASAKRMARLTLVIVVSVTVICVAVWGIRELLKPCPTCNDKATVCPMCNGKPLAYMEDCKSCCGTGNGKGLFDWGVCNACGGTGKISYTKECQSCGGYGTIECPTCHKRYGLGAAR